MIPSRQPLDSAARWARGPAGVNEADLAHCREELCRVGQEGVGLCGALLQKALKFGARKGEAVINVVREGVHCAHWSLLLWRIPGCSCSMQPVSLSVPKLAISLIISSTLL